MITVGNREVIFNHSFIIPVGEEVLFDAPSQVGGIKIAISFDEQGSDAAGGVASWSLSDNVLRIIFKGWKHSLGQAFKKPNKLGDLSDGRPFGFNVVHYYIGEVHFLTFDLYAGGTY